MAETQNNLLADVEAYVTPFLSENIPAQYVYHDLAHTQDVVRVSRQIGLVLGLPMDDLESLQIAAWFHDTGYDKGPENHEERSIEYARAFLEPYGLPSDKLDAIVGCIRATKVPQKPIGLLQQVICDADLSHLGEKTYWLRTTKVRQELVSTHNKLMSEDEWIDFELAFMMRHQYHTDIARSLYNKRKLKHIGALRKQKKRLHPEWQESMEDDFLFEDAKKQKNKARNSLKNIEKSGEKQQNIGRGVETMYRTTYNTHNNLSALADHKANLMLSINTIMISITISILVPQLTESPQLIIPTVVLLTVCLSSIVFATLSTRPKVTHGEVKLEDIRSKRSNLLFFGNFYNMKLEDFQWGMMEMIRDPDFQYSSMTRDLYYLGKVLAQKYRYLTMCYNIFMFGLILSVILFAVAFVFGASIDFRIN